MENVLENTFGDRLIYLYDSVGIDVSGRAWAMTAARKMFDQGILEYNNTDDPLEQRKQLDYVAHILKRHLDVTDASSLSGAWLDKYRRFFGCSAAYLFGEIPLPTITQTDICKATGLTASAVRVLEKIASPSAPVLSRRIPDVISTLLTTKNGILHSMYEYIHTGTVQLPEGDDFVTFTEAETEDDDLIVSHMLPVQDLYFASLQSAIMRDLESIRKQKK